MARSGKIARFLQFELDARTGELRIAGRETVFLAEQPLQILLAMLERPGELVTREELRQRLWPDNTVVEFEHSISVAMNRLRRRIGDSAEHPRVIETLGGRGYRLAAKVDWIDGHLGPTEQHPDELAAAQKAENIMIVPLARRYPWRTLSYAVAAVLFATSAIFILFQSWGVFSAPKTLIWKQRQLTVNSSENPATGSAISPDGKYLAYTDLRGIKLKLIATGESREFEEPDVYRGRSPNWQIDSWLPDSNHFFAIADLPMQPSALWLISVTGGVQQRLATGVSPWGVSPDGLWVAITTNNEEVWVLRTNGESRRMVVPGAENSRVRAVQWSPDGRYLAYVRNRRESNQQESQIEVVSVRDSKSHVLLSGESIHEVSTLEESFQDMVWMADGRLIFTGGEPDIHGLTCNLWQARIDLKTISASKPDRMTNWSGFCVFNLSQTADGKRLVYARSSDLSSVYVAQLDSKIRISVPTRLTLTDDLSSPSGWSPDSGAVYIRSNREGTWGLYQQAVSGGSAVPIITGLAALSNSAPISPDRKWILLIEPLHGPVQDEEKLVRIPIAGGPPEELLRGRYFSVACPRVSTASCVIGDLSADKSELIFSSLDLSRGRGTELARFADQHAAKLNWDLSPDGLRVVIYSDLSNHFSTMELTGESQPRVHITSDLHLRAITWAPNGRGFLCTNRNQINAQLLYLDAQGLTHVLWEVPGNNVFLTSSVAPDGRHLAIQTSAINSNVWMIEGF
jgi:DNA-binding winged helix-turn-helix (wHTH) protein/Tol biopolymer transport system component